MPVVYDNIKAIAEKKNIPIRQLEKDAGLGNGSIYKWKNVSPKISSLMAVADVLGVTVNRLLREDTTEKVQ